MPPPDCHSSSPRSSAENGRAITAMKSFIHRFSTGLLAASLYFQLFILVLLLHRNNVKYDLAILPILPEKLPAPPAKRKGGVPLLFALRQQVPKEKPCSCLDTSAPGRGACCSRMVRRAHKMGYILTKELFYPWRKRKRVFLSEKFRTEWYEREHREDYRDVVLTRNFVESMVSGYLYHLSGRECWLSINGIPEDMTDIPMNRKWKEILTVDRTSYYPILQNHTTICHYLVEAPMKDGLVIYMDMAYQRFYRGLDSSEAYLRANPKKDRNRTLFLCYEEMLKDKEKYFNLMLDHMFPGETHNWVDHSEKKKYDGGHATPKDPEQRTKLRNLVIEIDNTLFGGRLQDLDRRLGCGTNKARP